MNVEESQSINPEIGKGKGKNARKKKKEARVARARRGGGRMVKRKHAPQVRRGSGFLCCFALLAHTKTTENFAFFLFFLPLILSLWLGSWYWLHSGSMAGKEFDQGDLLPRLK